MAKISGQKMADFVTLRLDPELKSALAKAAEAEERSLGQMVRIFVREGIARRKKGMAITRNIPRKRKTS